MTVKITFLGEWRDDPTMPGRRYCTDGYEYFAGSRGECRDDTDRAVYDMVVSTGEVITMGAVVGEPA